MRSFYSQKTEGKFEAHNKCDIYKRERISRVNNVVKSTKSNEQVDDIPRSGRCCQVSLMMNNQNE